MYAAAAAAEAPLRPLLPFMEDGVVGEEPAERLPAAEMEVSRAGNVLDEAMMSAGESLVLVFEDGDDAFVDFGRRRTRS
jgi:hypothetical protein